MPDVEVRALRIRVDVDTNSLDRAKELVENMLTNLQMKCRLSLKIDTKALASSTAEVMSTVNRVASEGASAVEKATSGSFNEKKLKSFYLAQQKMQLQLNRMGSGASTKEFEQFNDLLNRVAANGGKGFESLASAAINARDSIRNLNREMHNAADVEELRTRLANKLGGGEWISGQAQRLQNSFVDADPQLVQAATAKLNEIRQLGDVSRMSESELNALNNALNQYNALMNAVGASNAANRSLREQATAIANLKSQYLSYMAEYGRALKKNPALMESFQQFGLSLSSGALTSGEAARQFAELRAQAQAAGIEIETTGQRMKGLFSTHFNTAIIMYALYGLRTLLRQLWKDVKDLNDALVQTQIVTGLAGASLRNYVEGAYSAAEKSKDSISNILEEATAYGRLGYDSNLSVQLAELTSMYGKIGNVDTSEATDAITALMKAFNLEDASQIEDALDKMIYVGNNFPISAAGLGESLNNAASALASSGNTLEQSLAMLMVANETVQNPSKSSTAMRTMTARIRNSKAELEGLGEEMEEQWNTVAKYRKQLLGVSGVDILDETGKEFRSTADILADLASVWQNLSSVEQATVTTMIAGTRNQDIFASLMANWGDYDKAMAGMGDAGGLMQEKFGAVEQSLSGSLSSLKNAWSEFSNALVNSGDIRSFISTITTLVQLFTKLTKSIGSGALLSGLLTFMAVLKQIKTFSAGWVGMQSAMAMLRSTNGIGGTLLNENQIRSVTAALAGYNAKQQMVIMSGAGMTVTAQQQVLAFQGLDVSTKAVERSTRMMGGAMDGARAKMSAFAISSNKWLIILTLIATVLNSIRGAMVAANKKALQAEADARKSVLDDQSEMVELINKTSAAMSDASSLDDQIAKLNSIADVLDEASRGSNEYKQANQELYETQKSIVDIFGEEAEVIRGVSGDLRTYAKNLGKAAHEKALKDMLSEGSYAGLESALQLFGYDTSGNKINGNLITIELPNFKLSDQFLARQTIFGQGDDAAITFGWDVRDSKGYILYDDLQGLFDKTLKDLHAMFGARFGYSLGFDWDNAQSKDFMGSFWSNTLLGKISDVDFRKVSMQLQSISAYGTILELINDLERQRASYASSNNESDRQRASEISELIGAIKDAIGYDSAKQLFDTFVRESMLSGAYGESAYNATVALQTASDNYTAAVTSGDPTALREAIKEFSGAMGRFREATKDIPIARTYAHSFETQYGGISKLDYALAYDNIKVDTLNYNARRRAIDQAMIYANEDETSFIVITPVLPDGTELSPEAFDEYAKKAVGGGPYSDPKNLRLTNGIYATREVAEEALRIAVEEDNLWPDYTQTMRFSELVPALNAAGISASKLKKVGSEIHSEQDAINAGLEYEYSIYQSLTGVAGEYETTTERIIDSLVTLYGLSRNGEGRYTTTSPVPRDYDKKLAFTGQTTATGATENVGAIDKRTMGFIEARSSFLHAISPYMEEETNDVWKLTEEESKDAIDAINEYFGTSFKEISEENYEGILNLFNAASEDIYGGVEKGLVDTLDFLAEYAEDYEIPMDNLFDVDSGMLNIEALIASFDGIPESADKAGALAYALLAQKLMNLAGMSFRLEQVGDVLKVVASDGYSLPPPKKSGGGGGKKSQLSPDIEAVERMIKLFKTLLNYYDEGSDQWIARQTQLIDKYKAGVEIAMNEYKRLKDKGLKETDADVKKIVDAILEYQDNIFDESKKLWEAVRQNQIDSLKHLKDQNDAAIKLEETHHDLLIAIRDERRELEDELKAARDAYSEVMTPEELDAMFSVEDYAELMDKLATIEGDAMSMYRDYKEQIAAVSEDETYMIDHITDEFKRQYELKMKEYEIAKAELGVARAQQELENVKNEQTVMMLIGGKWQWVADPEKVLEAEQKLADAEQELADAQDEFDFQSLINEMEAQSSGIQQQIDALEALTFSMDDLAEQIHLFSDSVYKELLTYLSQIAQGIFDKYEGDTAVPAFAEGGVIKRGGLAMVHSGEPIFSTADAEKLWRFVHDLGDTPVNTLGVYSGIANKLLDSGVDMLGGVSTVAIDNSINIPGGIHVHGEMAQQLITLLKEVVAPYQPNV